MMQILKLGIRLVLAGALVAPALGAQTVPPGKNSTGCIGIELVGAASNNPFSAWRVTRSVMKSPDGSQKATTSAEKVARDRDGRIRIERIVKVPTGTPEITLPAGDGESANVKWDATGTAITVTDCSTGEHISMQPDSKFAQVRSLGAGSSADRRNRPYRSLPSTLLGHTLSPQLSAEDIGSKQIAGIVAEGVRVTTFGTGEWAGKPTVIDETWASVDLAATIVEIRKDLKDGGESKRILVEIKREEPDASLFVIPPGYTISREFESRGTVPMPAPHE